MNAELPKVGFRVWKSDPGSAKQAKDYNAEEKEASWRRTIISKKRREMNWRFDDPDFIAFQKSVNLGVAELGPDGQPRMIPGAVRQNIPQYLKDYFDAM